MSSSVSPASSPIKHELVDSPASAPYPLPFLTSVVSSTAAQSAAGTGAFPSSSMHAHMSDPSRSPFASSLQLSWDNYGPSSSGGGSGSSLYGAPPAQVVSTAGTDGTSPLVRFLPIAEPGNGPREALYRMHRLAQQSDARGAANTPDPLVVSSAKYTTSADVRGYIPVYEFPLGEQVMMIDSENGLVHWTSIWKLLGNSKADMVRLVEMQPEVGALLKKVRGGYLKIQGTWLPYDIALNLSRRVAYPIRHMLEPLFGPNFPSSCLTPTQAGYGQITLSAPGTSTRRGRQRRVVGAEARRAPTSPRSQLAAQTATTAQYRPQEHAPTSGPIRYTAPVDGEGSRYAPYPSYSQPPPQQQQQQYYGNPYSSSAGHAHNSSVASMYPEAATQFYPPPPATAPTVAPLRSTDVGSSLGAYRFPPAPASYTAQLVAPLHSAPTSSANTGDRPSIAGRTSSSLSITQLLSGATPPDTPFSLPLPLAGPKYAVPNSGDQHQLSVLDGAVVPRRGSQTFKRLVGDRDDLGSPLSSSAPHSAFFRRDSLPSPLRSSLPGLSLSERRGPSPPLSTGSHLASRRRSTVDTERDDDALSAHSSGVSSPRSTADVDPPVVIRTDSRDDTDDRSRQGSFNSTLGVFLGHADAPPSTSWAKPYGSTSAARFPSIPSASSSMQSSDRPPQAAAAESVQRMPAHPAVDMRRHSSSSEHLAPITTPFDGAHACSSERSLLAGQSSSLTSAQRSPLRPW